MRSRTFREGSVGLLLLAGLGVFGIIFLWLNRLTVGQTSYKAIVDFTNAGGMQKGTNVRYRGVKVGRISNVRPGSNGVEVEIEITQPNLIIPRDVLVEANQSGLISESMIDITPQTNLASGINPGKPLDPNCDKNLIICNGSRLKGNIGISVDELIRTSSKLATVYTDPKFYSNVNDALKNTAEAAAQIARLSRDFSGLARSSQQQLGSFSNAANSVSRAADKISVSTSQTVDKLGATTNQFNATATQFGTTAKDLSSTAKQASRLLTNLDSLVTTNRSSLVAALNNITKTSEKLSTTVNSLSPTVDRFTKGELLQNLETLSANAAQASANLRDASKTLNDPNNVLVLQQTLDSARVTFENTQKITSDLDELTGDPKFRENVKRLVNGLSSLVSSTDQIEEKVKIAATLESVRANANNPDKTFPTPGIQIPDVKINTFSTPFKSATKKPLFSDRLTNTSSQETLLRELRQYKQQREQENKRADAQVEFSLTED
jgi:phospholipid/cholesterol/gamma-HCH transport system substrate-binding protein